MGKAKRKPARSAPTSLEFFAQLNWLDGRNLLDTMQQYRRSIFTAAFDTVRDDGAPKYNLVLAGRGKKNDKTLDLVLGALFTLVCRRSVQGSDCYILANDTGQANDDLSLAKKLIQCNPALAGEIEVFAKELRLRDGSASLKILPGNDAIGAHGKSAAFVAFDEIHGYRNWDLLEAMQLDPHRREALMWITSYASIYSVDGAPLHDLMQIGKAHKDPRMLFSWYSGDYCTDPACEDLAPEVKANPSFADWAQGMEYINQQRERLPTGRFRRLHLNLPGSPEGAALSQAQILACVVTGRRSLPPQPGIRYYAVTDLSHGSLDDTVLCICHLEGKLVVIDLVLKQNRPTPFNTHDVITHQFAPVIKSYGCHRVYGDAAGGATYRLDFGSVGIQYQVITTSASDLYENFEPVLNAGEVHLLDHGTTIEQLCCLIWRGNKITHEHNSHDDHANAIALAVKVARGQQSWIQNITPALLETIAASGRRSRVALYGPGPQPLCGTRGLGYQNRMKCFF